MTELNECGIAQAGACLKCNVWPSLQGRIRQLSVKLFVQNISLLWK